jgi:hypothetical protein
MHPDVPMHYSAWPLFRNIQMILTLVLPEVAVMAAWEEFSDAWRISNKCAGIQGLR